MAQTDLPAPPPLAEPNLAAAIRIHAQQRPTATALVEIGADGRQSWTWAEFEQAVTERASALVQLGLVAGHRVVVQARPTLDAVATWFGALRAGVVAVPVNPGKTPHELTRVVEHCGARVLIGESDLDLPGVRIVALTELAGHAGDAPIASPQDPEAVAAVIYTSGTSGNPKGAMLSHRALLAHCTGAFRRGLARREATVLCGMPLFHVFGLNAVLGAGVFAGSTMVLVEGIPDDLGEILKAEQITHLPLIPSVLYRLTLAPDLADSCRSLQTVTSGAAPLPAALASHWLRQTGIPVHQGYGLTEAAPGVTNTLGTDWLGSNHVGRALPGVEIRIGDGSEPTEPGEVMIRGNNLFSGYWPDGSEGPADDGWFATGDVGYLMGEDLFLVDRVREVIIVSGFNVYPAEIEEVLEQHPDVVAAAVVGQADEHTGERVVAFVTGDSVEPSAVLAFASARLARYKMPAELLVIKAMPRTASGKIRKNLLRDLLDRTDEEDF
ncbi:MAG: class I adenylate-forming enzyme family protein [Propionibacteriaceae bacterium]|nr:class I adenylate-forming enzyme family protein [Propionibacteriaceae bacterium]